MVVHSSPTAVLDDRGFREMVDALARTHDVMGPTVRDGSIVLAPIGRADDLPAGHTLDQAPGRCRIEELDFGDRRRFAWAVGPDSAKVLQHPSERVLFTATVDEYGVPVVQPPPGEERPVAVLGLRPCDAAAAGVLHRVIGEAGEQGWAAPGGRPPFVVVVNCTEPGGTCFCASMGTGPALGRDRAAGVDIELWERGGTDGGDGGPEYLVTHTSPAGAELLSSLGTVPAEDADSRWVDSAVAASVQEMGRQLDTEALPERLAATLGSDRWDDVAQRCLSCGNCTMVCPTCFCASVHDTSELDGSAVSRTQRWDSCFSLDHSYIHGGSVRSGVHDRYRQWLTHKLSTWWGQFGESGCVGCGRCISWCPVGIDLVEEASALSAEAAAPGYDGDATAGAATSVLLRRRAVAQETYGSGGSEGVQS